MNNNEVTVKVIVLTTNVYSSWKSKITYCRDRTLFIIQTIEDL